MPTKRLLTGPIAVINLYGEGALKLFFSIIKRSKALLFLLAFYYILVITNQLLEGKELVALALDAGFLFLMLKWAAILIPSIWILMLTRIMIQRFVLVLSYCREHFIKMRDMHGKDIEVLCKLLKPLKLDK